MINPDLQNTLAIIAKYSSAYPRKFSIVTISRVAHAVASVTNTALEEAEDSASQIDGVTFTSGDRAYSSAGTVSITSCKGIYHEVTSIEQGWEGGSERGSVKGGKEDGRGRPREGEREGNRGLDHGWR